MDGYAIGAPTRGGDRGRAGDPRGHRRRRGRGAARDVGGAGTAVRIATGAPVPHGRRRGHPGRGHHAARRDRRACRRARPGRDRPAAGSRSLVHAAMPVGGSIRRHGQRPRAGRDDHRSGHGRHARGIVASPRAWAREHRRPPPSAHRVLATGDEVRAPGPELGPAGIPDANGPALMAMVDAAGGYPIDLGIARPPRRCPCRGCAGPGRRCRRDHRLRWRLGRAVRRRARRRSRRVGRIDLWRVAVQPGKPFAFGTPASARTTAPTRTAAAVRAAGQPGLDVRDVRAIRPARDPRARRPRRCLSAGRSRGPRETVSKSSGRRAFIRVDAERDERGPRSATSAAACPSTWRRGRAGEPRDVRPRDRRRARGHPRSRRHPRRRRGRAVVARPRLTVASPDRHGSDRDQPEDRGPPPPRRTAPPALARRPEPAAARWSTSPTSRSPRAERWPRRIAVDETLSLVIDGGGPKGDVLGVAELAGSWARKRTSELIPLCHPLPLTDLEVTITPDRANRSLRIRAEAATTGQTGSRWRR